MTDNLDLTSVMDTVLDHRTKGIPESASPFKLGDIARQGWNVLREDMPLPLMLLKRSALDHNAKVFGGYLKDNDLSLAPHGKTTMAPQIFSEQLANGAWGITAATVGQVQVMRHYGVPRVIMANQLVGRANIAAIAALINTDPGFDFYTYVDSVGHLAHMDQHLSGARLDRPLKLLIEVGAAGGRTGVRTMAEAEQVVQALAAADPARFRFAGIGVRRRDSPRRGGSVDCPGPRPQGDRCCPQRPGGPDRRSRRTHSYRRRFVFL